MNNHRKFRRLFRLDNDRNDVERAVDDELQFHFEHAVRDLVAKGASDADARRQAETRFGDLERTRRGLNEIDRARVSASRRGELFANVWQDLRYAARGIRRKPGFAVAVVVILALGIGANATMFGVVDRLLLRAPNYLVAPDRVHRLNMASLSNGQEVFDASTSYHRFRDLTDSAKSIDGAVAVWSPTLAIGIENAREHLVIYASAGLWKLFDARPLFGRFYTADEDVPDHPTNVVVLSYNFWKSSYGAQKDVIGKSVRIGRFNYTIVGVAPRGFSGFSNQDPAAFLPISSGADNSFAGNGRSHWDETYGLSWLEVIVRRKPDVNLVATTTEMSTLFRRSYDAAREKSPSMASPLVSKPRVLVAPVQSQRGPNQGSDVKVAVWLVGVALIVLVIACANVSNLMLARALRRQREIAVRLALGISRARLLAQLLVESTLLAMLGGVAGLAITQWGGQLLRTTLLPDMTWTSALTDGRTLLFTIVVAAGVGVVTGLVPAWRAGHTSLSSSLKAGSREGTHQRSVLRSTLLVMQAALSVVLLVGAGLFVRSLTNVQDIRLGFDANNIALVEPNMRDVKLDSAQQRLLYDEMLRAAHEVGGAKGAVHAAMVPFASSWDEPIFVAGVDTASTSASYLLQIASPGYFATMGTRIVRGRALDASDNVGSQRVAVVSQSMARKLWPRGDALSQCFRIDTSTSPCTYVIGIAEDLHWRSLTDDAALQYYLPRDQRAFNAGVLFVRLSGNAARASESVRAAVQGVMPGGAYVTVRSMFAVVDPQRRSWQLGATMFALFGLLALVVASIGLYSVISYSVEQRSQEMGVRLALGARSVDVVRMILQQSISLSAFAVLLGLGVSLVASQWIKPLMYNTSAFDPVVYAGVAATLLIVALVAALVPALRASRVDPSTALRSD